jgi:hypothetical protein
MPIRMMTGKENANQPNVETVRNYPGHEEGMVCHRYGCSRYEHQHDFGGPLTAECTDKGCSFREPLYMATTHVGLVLSTGEHNGYDDSDFYAIVWNPVEKKTEKIQYATTRGWTYPNSATVDATPEVCAEYEAWVAHQQVEAQIRRQSREVRVPRVGTTVKVVKGRKVPVGTLATVVWFGEDQYYRGSRYANPHAAAFMDTLTYVEMGKYRIGIMVNGKREFINAQNVEVVTE